MLFPPLAVAYDTFQCLKLTFTLFEGIGVGDRYYSCSLNSFQINPSNYRSVTCAPNPSPPPTKIN